MSCKEKSLSPDGKKKLLAPKRKRLAIWKTKPKRVARKFHVVTPSGLSAHREEEPDAFEDLVRKNSQVATVDRGHSPGIVVCVNSDAENTTAANVCSAKVPIEQPSNLITRRNSRVSNSRASQSAKTDGEALERKESFCCCREVESSEQHECVSMDMTCSSSERNAQDLATPAVIQNLENQQRQRIDVCKVRSFLDQLACRRSVLGAASNRPLKVPAVSLPLSNAGGGALNILPHESSLCEQEINKGLTCHPCPVSDHTLPNRLSDDKDLMVTIIVAEEGVAMGGVFKEDLAEKGVVEEDMAVEGVVKGAIAEESVVKQGAVKEGVIEEGVVKQGVVREGVVNQTAVKEGVVNEDVIEKKASEKVGRQFEDTAKVERTSSCENHKDLCAAFDTSIETVRDKDLTDEEVMGSGGTVTLDLQDSDKECSQSSKNTRYSRVGGVSVAVFKIMESESEDKNMTVVKEVGRADKTVVKEMGREDETATNKVVDMVAASNIRSVKKKLSLSRRHVDISLCPRQKTADTVNRTPQSTTPPRCPASCRWNTEISLDEHFSALHLTPIASLQQEGLPVTTPTQKEGLPITSTPICSSSLHSVGTCPCLQQHSPCPYLEAFGVTLQEPHPLTSTTDKTEMWERLLDFDEIGFDANTCVSTLKQLSSHKQSSETGFHSISPCPHSISSCPKQSYTSTSLKKNTHFIRVLSGKKQNKVHFPNAVRQHSRTPKQRGEVTYGTTPPSCVLIRLHEKANLTRKKVHQQPPPRYGGNTPEDVLVTIVNNRKPRN